MQEKCLDDACALPVSKKHDSIKQEGCLCFIARSSATSPEEVEVAAQLKAALHRDF
jgi:hypothetical protein